MLASTLRADSQVAYVYDTWIDSDSYVVHVDISAAPGTPDGQYHIDLTQDSAPFALWIYVEVVNGVCNPSSYDYWPDPVGAMPGAFYISASVLRHGAGEATTRSGPKTRPYWY